MIVAIFVGKMDNLTHVANDFISLKEEEVVEIEKLESSRGEEVKSGLGKWFRLESA